MDGSVAVGGYDGILKPCRPVAKSTDHPSYRVNHTGVASEQLQIRQDILYCSRYGHTRFPLNVSGQRHPFDPQ